MLLPGMIGLLAMALPDAVIVRPVANMYSEPSEEGSVVSQAIYASNVSILEEKDGWIRIRTGDEYSGWVPSAGIRRGKYAASGRVAMVQSLAAHLYREPNLTRHAPLVTVPYETRLEVVAEPEEEDRRWLEVRLPDDRAAWVQRGDLTFDMRVLDVPEMITLAKRFLGLPYTWGGTSSFGYDCSGYTQMLCRRMGKSLPRDARPQAEWSGMRAISKDELRPGDLLYFGQAPGKITHTGIYIGNGEFIHATAHEKPVIQISRLSEPHWTELLAACRRWK
ncbi:MAG: C40 family peptidase [Bryobacterales bacterium]|nr:C40 family peptidase [Bryobacterales bacterium]